MAYRGKHEVREEEAQLLARWSGRRRAGTAGRASSSEARSGGGERVRESCYCCCCAAAGGVKREVRSVARSAGEGERVEGGAGWL